MKLSVLFCCLFISTAVRAQTINPPAPVLVEEDSAKQKQLIYEYVEQEPSFPGGMQKFLEYLQNNIQYPPKALKDSIEGKVYMSFIVNTDGSLSDFKILKGIPELNEEALRVMKNSPKWIPGKMNGKPVRSRARVPIIFRLE